MTEVNLQLFDDHHAEVGLSLDMLDNMLDVVALRKNWPKILSELVDLFYAELCRQNVAQDEAVKMAPKLVGALGYYFGGRVCYIPSGERLWRVIRDNRIFLDYQIGDGNITALAKKYKLTDSHIYFIIREQLAFHRRKLQPDFFEEQK